MAGVNSLSCESQTHFDAHGGGCKLFETRELREKHVHDIESTRVESGDDDPICVTKEGGARGQSKRGYINYCVSMSSLLYNLWSEGGSFTSPYMYPTTISNTHYAYSVGVAIQ